MNRETFNRLLKKVVQSLKGTKQLVQDASDVAMAHFYEHGDTSYCQALLDVFENEGKNFVRRAAYLMWLRTFAPITMIDGKLVKDKSETAIVMSPELLAASKAKAFWEFSPEKEDIIFSETDVVVCMQKALKRLHGTKSKPLDDAAVARLAAAEALVADFAATEAEAPEAIAV